MLSPVAVHQVVVLGPLHGVNDCHPADVRRADLRVSVKQLLRDK
jgi:hypothetical protein